MKETEQDAGIRTGWWWKELSDMLVSELVIWNALSKILELKLANAERHWVRYWNQNWLMTKWTEWSAGTNNITIKGRKTSYAKYWE